MKTPTLRSILTAFYADHQSNLHDGRSAAQPDIEAYVRKIEALYAPLLPRLWHSSTDLLERFQAQPSVKQASDRMMSEVLELVVAAHDTYGSSTQDIAEEAADVLVTLINVLRAACVTQEQFVAALETTMKKNVDKTDATHQLNVHTQGVERIGSRVVKPESANPRFQSLAARALHGDGE